MGFRNDAYLTEIVVPWCKSGDAATTTDATALPLLLPRAHTVVGVRALVATAPTGTPLIVDLHNNGVTMFTTQANRPTIAITTLDSGAWAVPDLTAIVADDVLTVNVDQIGSGDPGTQLTVELRLLRRV